MAVKKLSLSNPAAFSEPGSLSKLGDFLANRLYAASHAKGESDRGGLLRSRNVFRSRGSIEFCENSNVLITGGILRPFVNRKPSTSTITESVVISAK